MQQARLINYTPKQFVLHLTRELSTPMKNEVLVAIKLET